MDVDAALYKVVISLIELKEELSDFGSPEESLQLLLTMVGSDIRDENQMERIQTISRQALSIIEELQKVVGSENVDVKEVGRLNSLKGLVEELNQLSFQNPFSRSTSSLVLEFVVIYVLRKSFPKAFHALKTLRLIQALPNSPGYGYKLVFENLEGFLLDLGNFVSKAYSSDDQFLVYKLLDNLEDYLLSLGIGAYLTDPNEQLASYLEIDPNAQSQDQALRLSASTNSDTDLIPIIKLDIFPSKSSDGSKYTSLLLHPRIFMSVGKSIPFSGSWEVSLLGNVEGLANQVISIEKDGIVIRNLGAGQAAVNSDFRFSLSKREQRTKRNIESSGNAFGFEQKGVSVGLSLDSLAKASLFIETQAIVKLGIPAGQGDSLIKNILPDQGIQSMIDLTLGWNSSEGLYFNYAAGLETTIPIHRKVGPVDLKSAFLYLGFQDASLNGKAGVSFSATLGIATLLIEKVGMQAFLNPNNDGKPSEIKLSGPDFLFPQGIAASLDTSIISGGGYLDIDKENHRYNGILSLTFLGFDITAIGLIATKLPNGEDGFSMLVSISVEFFPPVQLSFGFTFVGVGGIVGINRTMKVDEIRKQLSEGAIGSIMFPKDVIANADKVISDLRTFFPPKKDHFVVAPFIKLGFGTPSIIEVDLGLMLEFPFAGRIILLGSLGIYLPTKKTILVEIHIDVLGDFNFAEQYIRIEGRLRQSHILRIALNGGFAFMLDWGRRPAFLFSIGGYHPRYRKPASFPDIPRLSAVIRLGGDGASLSIMAEYYQAITSNSFQIGFGAYMKATALDFSIEASYSFHAMLQFNPLFFSTEQSMSVQLKYKSHSLAGISLYFLLSGPSSWRASGHAEISILFISVKISFEVSFGKSTAQPRTYESLDSLKDRVKVSLEQPSNWTAQLPPDFMTGEMLRAAEELQEEGIVLHPSGFLQARQTVLPFNYRIEKFGNSYVRETPKFSFDEQVTIGRESGKLKKDQYVKEPFARGQFEELSKAKQLSSPDFEDFVSGISLGSGEDEGFDLGGTEVVSQDPMEYEFIVLDNTAESRYELIGNFSKLASELQALLASVPLTQTRVGSGIATVFDYSPQPEEIGYNVVSSIDGTSVMAQPFQTYGEAQQFITYEANGDFTNLFIQEETILV